MNDNHHEAYEKLLYLYRENELNRCQRLRLRRHLRSCTACREELASVQKSLDDLQVRLHAGSAPRPPASLRGRIMTAVIADSAGNGRKRHDQLRQRSMSLAMAGMVLFITCSFVFQGLSGMLKMQRFEQKLHRTPQPASSLAAISSLRKTISAQDLSQARISLAGQRSLVEIIHPHLGSVRQTAEAVMIHPDVLLPPALLSRIAARLYGPATRERGL